MAVFVVFAAAVALGGFFSFRSDAAHDIIEGDNPDVPTLTFYTTGMATTPQIPFWAALRCGEFSNMFNVRVRMWRNADDLQNVMLAGKGDIWLGHVDGFALARKRGAPVVLVAVTGWRKFYLITNGWNYDGIRSLRGKTVAYAPPGSPAVALFNKIAEGIFDIHLQPYQGKELAMLLLRNRVDTAIVPEPILSMLLLRNRNLRVAASIEDMYGKKTGGPTLIPMAGVAVNEKMVKKHPALVALIQDAMVRMAVKCEKDPVGSVKYLPQYFEQDIPQHVVRESMSRDVILVKRGVDVEGEITEYLKVILPSLVNVSGKLDLGRGFLWER